MNFELSAVMRDVFQMEKGATPVLTILCRLYSYTTFLEKAIAQLCNITLCHPEDSKEYQSFCSTTILASNREDDFHDGVGYLFQIDTTESLHFIIGSLNKHWLSRCLAHLSELSLLHSRIGDRAMKFILSKASLFVALGVGNNYIQITGNAIYDVMGLTYTPLHMNCSRQKHRITDNEVPGGEKQLYRYFPTAKRPKLLLEKNDCTSDHCLADGMKSGGPQLQSLGLKRKKKKRRRVVVHRKRRKIAAHIRRQAMGNTSSCGPVQRNINRVKLRQLKTIWSTTFRKKDIMYSSSSQEKMRKSSNDLQSFSSSRRGATKLVKHIFMKKKMEAPKMTSKQKVERLPKRYHAAVPYFQEMLKKYEKMDRKILFILNQYFQDFSEESEVDMQKAMCDPLQVFKFVMCVLNLLVPQKLWGSRRNKTIFYTLCLRRWERLSVRQLLHGMKTSHCDWLKIGGGGRGSKGQGTSDMLKQREMFSSFLAWVMELSVELVKGYFYATDHSDHHNRVVYYRKKVWKRLCKVAIEEKKEMLKPLNEEELNLMLSRGKPLGVSNLRFMPKSSSLRPISNLSAIAKLDDHYTVPGQGITKPVNVQLFDLFSILKFEKGRKYGSTSCMGYKDIHSRLKSFAKNNIPSQQDQRKPFYAVHVDVTNCFDSILPLLLYSIIQKKVITQVSYLLRRYATIMISNQAIKRQFVKVGTTRELCEPFYEFAKLLPLQNCILADMVTYPVINRVSVLTHLRSHLFYNIVKILPYLILPVLTQLLMAVPLRVIVL